MNLKVGDVVEFKKYEDMADYEAMWISEDLFPKYGKITEVVSDDFFYIEGDGYLFNIKSVTRIISSKKEELAMDLKVGDLVVFKKYEDMTDEEQAGISEDSFPKFGKVSFIYNESKRFFIEGEPYVFDKGSVDYIIVKAVAGDINVGDEVLVKAKVLEVKGDNILVPWISKNDVVEVLNHKEEHFIVQEDHYGMYVNGSEVLVVNKDDAKIFNSRNEANEVASGMHLNAWKVIPYDD